MLNIFVPSMTSGSTERAIVRELRNRRDRNIKIWVSRNTLKDEENKGLKNAKDLKIVSSVS